MKKIKIITLLSIVAAMLCSCATNDKESEFMLGGVNPYYIHNLCLNSRRFGQ